MSVYVFQPFNVKEQDGVGRNAGAGDTNLMLSFAFKWDEGLQLVPEKESLDDLMDWHFSVAIRLRCRSGRRRAKGDAGAYFAPDMQTGFGAPSPALGVAAMKQLTTRSHLARGGELPALLRRTPTASPATSSAARRVSTRRAVYRVYDAGGFRLDLSGELNGLQLQRDRQRNDAGAMEPLQASGGAILYAGAGVRAYYGPFTVGLGVKRAALKRLNEQSDQQGSEGLERFRAAFTVSYSTGF